MGNIRHALIGFTLLAGPATATAAADVVPAATAVKIIADGAPWSALTANGRRAKITLNRDGTGTFEGPITMSISWAVEKEFVCLNLMMAGRKCLQFRKVLSGYEGLADGKVDLTLSR